MNLNGSTREVTIKIILKYQISVKLVSKKVCIHSMVKPVAYVQSTGYISWLNLEPHLPGNNSTAALWKTEED